ncbi:uncharacterized protein LOC127003093 [Eriocheir sinensis]|uniref:uncharacterized protein LOC127003093 n=1 Tax=Eriocheir sinensis TaxID=95602 RepID=UPI0021C5B3FB|nr:uncharacterized protein LOC127003093 [Eriocheir sinensis]
MRPPVFVMRTVWWSRGSCRALVTFGSSKTPAIETSGAIWLTDGHDSSEVFAQVPTTFPNSAPNIPKVPITPVPNVLSPHLIPQLSPQHPQGPYHPSPQSPTSLVPTSFPNSAPNIPKSPSHSPTQPPISPRSLSPQSPQSPTSLVPTSFPNSAPNIPKVPITPVPSPQRP